MNTSSEIKGQHIEENFYPASRYMVGSEVNVSLDGGKKAAKGKIHDFDPETNLFKVVWNDSNNVSHIEQLTKEELDIANFDPNEYRGRMADILEPAKPPLEYNKPLRELDLEQVIKDDIIFLQSSNYEINQFKVLKADKNGVLVKCVTGPCKGDKGYFPVIIRTDDPFVFTDKTITSVKIIEVRKSEKEGNEKWESVKRNIMENDARSEASGEFMNTALLDENGKLKTLEGLKNFFSEKVKSIRGFENVSIADIRSEFDKALKAPEDNKYRTILIGIAKSMLGVNDDDRRAQIERKSGKIMALYHPDRLSGAEGADKEKKQLFEDIFSLLNSAKQLLIDNVKEADRALAA